jgi:putative CRISPR-associated protein (TIGR02619 family)
MPICVISTVGASVFTQASEDIRSEWRTFDQQQGLDLQKIARETHDFPGRDLYQRVMNHLKAIADSPNSEDRLMRASAELKSLFYILKGHDANKNDILHFFATDTPAGTLAARIISDFAREYFKIQTEVVRIEGLQVTDDTSFNTQGIRRFISRVFDRLNKASRGTYRRVLNPTGGYKGVVPYLTLIGMIEEDVEISYIYETSSALITLRRIPMTLDYTALGSAHDALLAANREFISRDTLAELLGVDAQELLKHPALSLFDVDDDQYSINGLGVIVLNKLGIKPDYEVYLSEQAKKAFDKLNESSTKTKYETYFDGAANKSWFESHIHSVKNAANAIVLKIGHTDERVWAFREGQRVLIAELTRHTPSGDYEVVPRARDDYDYYSRWEVSQ